MQDFFVLFIEFDVVDFQGFIGKFESLLIALQRVHQFVELVVEFHHLQFFLFLCVVLSHEFLVGQGFKEVDLLFLVKIISVET